MGNLPWSVRSDFLVVICGTERIGRRVFSKVRPSPPCRCGRKHSRAQGPSFSGISPSVMLPGLHGVEGLSYRWSVWDVCPPPYLYPERSVCVNANQRDCECATSLAADANPGLPQIGHGSVRGMTVRHSGTAFHCTCEAAFKLQCGESLQFDGNQTARIKEVLKANSQSAFHLSLSVFF